MTSATNYAATSPVAAEQTRVTGRRIVQYIIDSVLSSIIPAVLYFALVHGHGALYALGIAVAAVLSIAWYFWYWAFRPYRADGQTFGMQWLGIRVISKDGGPASLGQLVVRWIFLVVGRFFAPLGELVALITILFSRLRQRVGDHAAGTVVIRKDEQAMPAPVDGSAAEAGPAGPHP